MTLCSRFWNTWKKCAQRTNTIPLERCTAFAVNVQHTRILIACTISDHDPRWEDGYDDSSTVEKCKKMTHFLSSMVSNIRDQFHFEDFANPDKTPNGIGPPRRWAVRRDINSLRALRNTKRCAFALNIAALVYAQNRIATGSHLFVYESLLG